MYLALKHFFPPKDQLPISQFLLVNDSTLQTPAPLHPMYGGLRRLFNFGFALEPLGKLLILLIPTLPPQPIKFASLGVGSWH